jgi:chromosome partitioning protein
MKIITTAIIKGGTGKTATAAALAQAGVYSGKKVLAIDLDPQANLTISLGANPNEPGSVNLFKGTPAADVLQETEQHITVIAAHRDLANEQTTPGSAWRLQQALEPLKRKYDLCIIDTPPTLGELVYNALNATNGLLIPLEADTSSLQGLYQIIEIAQQIKKNNTKLKILGTVLTRYDGRPKINQQLREIIAQVGEANGAPLLMAIRSGVAVKEAAAMQLSLFEYAPKSKPAADYMQLFNTITK